MLATRQAAARRDQAGSSSAASSWTKDGKGFFYGRYPEPPRRQGARRRGARQEDLLPRCSAPAARRPSSIYERKDKPTLFIDARPRRDRPISVHLDATRARATRTSCSSRISATRSRRSSIAPVSAAVPGSHRRLRPARRRQRRRCICRPIATRPTRKSSSVPIERPDASNWKTDRPRGEGTRSSRRDLVAGKIASSRSWTSRATVQVLQARRNVRPRRSTLPGLGTIERTVRPLRTGTEIFYTFTSPLRTRSTVFRSTSAAARARRSKRRSSRSTRALHDEAGIRGDRRTARACRCSSRTRRT